MFSSSFSRQTSNTLSPYQEIVLPSCESGRRGSNSRPLAWKANALSTELLPQKQTASEQLFIVCKRRCNPDRVGEWEEMDSNHRRRTPADLQSAPFGHSGIFPSILRYNLVVVYEPMEGFEPTTPRLQITCSGQLSYIGINRYGLQR